MVTFPKFDPFYIAYIDEAGDPGLSKVRPHDAGGASEWLTLGAVVIEATRERETVEWVRQIRIAIRETQGPELHFRNLSDVRKTNVSKMAAKLPLVGFVMLSHKPNMKGYRNIAAEMVDLSPTPRGWFYNWCIRLLLERVTTTCRIGSIAATGKVQPLKLVFSSRGGVAYNWLWTYLEVLKNQAERGTTVLTHRQIAHDVLHRSLIEDVSSRSSAGCQLADVIASAFHVAADANANRWCTKPAEALWECMAMDRGFHEDCGVSLQPWPPRYAASRLSKQQKQIFDFYRFNFN